MTCETYQELVSAHVDEMLTDSEREAAEAHLRSCADCARLFDGEQRFRQAFRARHWHIPASPGMERRLRAALTAESTGRSSYWRGGLAGVRAPRPGAVMLAAASLLAAFVLAKPFSRPPEQALLAAATAYYDAATTGTLALAYATNDPRGLEATLSHSGHLNFYPPFIDLRPVGYRLQGGMVTEVGGHPTAVTVYAGDEGQIIFLCQGGTMPPPPRGAQQLRGREYLYVKDGQTVLYSQFPDYFCVQISDLPADAFLGPLMFVPVKK